MKQRILTGLLGGAGFLFIVWLGSWWFACLVLLLAIIAYIEFTKMAGLSFRQITPWLGALFLLLIILPYLPATAWLARIHTEKVFLLLCYMLLMITVISKNKLTIERIGALVLGIVYISFGFSFFLETRLVYGLEMILFVLLVIWATDTGAYFVGRKLGRHKLWPAISPNKSIEGAVGGWLIAVFVALIFQWAMGIVDSWIHVMLLASGISLLGQMGDLVESAFKRHFQVKDSGQILPGHGGVLDRFDSILFVFPLLHIFHLI